VASSKTHYDHLDLPPTATAEEIKRSFRALIARYHPDKVQHLGKEFQDMAADRAAELTEAYRILSDAGRRADYDRGLRSAPPPPQPAAAPAPPPPVDAAPRSEGRQTPPSEPAAPRAPESASFKPERAVRDEYLRKATLSRFRNAVNAVGGGYDEAETRGFELAFVPKSKLFGRNKNPRLLGRFVSRVDGPEVNDTWVQAGKWTADEVCVFLLGSSLAPARELATAISEQRRRSRNSKVTLIPVDARDWAAHIPTDAPDIVRILLAKLKSGT